MIKQSRDLAKGSPADCQFLHSKILIYTVLAVPNNFSLRKKFETLCIAEIGLIQCSSRKTNVSANADDTIYFTAKLLSSSKQF